jgi:hypothetical protein
MLVCVINGFVFRTPEEESNVLPNRLFTRLTAARGVTSFVLKGDVLLVVLTFNNPLILFLLNFASFLHDINLVLSSFHN